ncbi:MAG: tryptophan synthase subunit alpha [Deltaproteobacteria bacterium]|nr:tryptophan synthase subunit alpha [Deltaproteobacteria bacterium]
MSRISKKFRELKNQKRKALIPFITAGDPSLAATEKLIFRLEAAGADLIELGVPFSDPMADGPVIQASSERALRKKIDLQKIFKLVARVRKKTQIPILLMGYYNPIFAMGPEKFAKKAAVAGVDGVLTVDLPPEEAAPLARCLKKNRIDPIFLLAPTSDGERIQKAARIGSGFLYYVSLTGITGARLTINRELADQVKKIRSMSRLPVVVGFGISNPKEARLLSRLSDGIVIGSLLVSKLNPLTPANVKKISQLVQKISHTINN